MCKNILHILHNSPKMAVLAPQWITGGSQGTGQWITGDRSLICSPKMRIKKRKP